MKFEGAMVSMRSGWRVAREGWNGKGMWICIGKGQKDVPADQFWNKHTKAFAEANGGAADVLPYLIMKTADGKILMGWLASQSDLLAEDWDIVDDTVEEDKRDTYLDPHSLENSDA